MKKNITVFTLLLVVLLFGGAGCFSFDDSDEAKTSGPAGMFVSTDKGDSWNAIYTLPQADAVKTLDKVSVFRLAGDPQDPKTLYWASREEGLFFTYDEGRSWTQAAEPLNDGFVYDVAVDPASKCTIIATDGYIVYKSEDCSRSWKEIHRENNLNARISALYYSPHGGHDIYMTKISGDLLISRDGGDSWTVLERIDGRAEEIVIDPIDPNLIYVASKEDGLFRSLDGGISWEQIDKKLKEFSKALKYRRFYAHPTKGNTIYWISTYGILVSTDKGDTWTPMSLITSPGSVDIYGFAINPNNDQEIYYTSTLKGRSTFYKTLDGGANWVTEKLPSNQIPTAVCVHPQKDEYVYVGFTIPPTD